MSYSCPSVHPFIWRTNYWSDRPTIKSLLLPSHSFGRLIVWLHLRLEYLTISWYRSKCPRADQNTKKMLPLLSALKSQHSQRLKQQRLWRAAALVTESSFRTYSSPSLLPYIRTRTALLPHPLFNSPASPIGTGGELASLTWPTVNQSIDWIDWLTSQLTGQIHN